MSAPLQWENQGAFSVTIKWKEGITRQDREDVEPMVTELFAVLAKADEDKVGRAIEFISIANEN